MSRGSRIAGVGALLLPVLVGVGQAQAQSADDLPKAVRKLPQRRAGFVAYRGWVGMTVSWRDVVDAKIRSKLLSGLPTVIATRAYVFQAGSPQPGALSAKTCRVVYDLWDEVFRIDLHQGGRRRHTVAVNVEGVLRRCAEARRLPVVPLRTVKTGRHFVGVIVEVNPVSKKTLERIRRWVALPKGAGAVGPGDSLFGSFVGLFVTHVPAADRTLSFRTQTFAEAELPRLKPPKKGSKP